MTTTFADSRHCNFMHFGAMLLIVLMPAFLFADTVNTKDRTLNKLSDGVYEIRHPDAPDGFPQGNTTVVIGDRDVLVVDSCLLPSSAREDIAQIRRWTDKPVSFLVNTHWHFDHTLGNATYREAFPAVQIIAQVETARTIAAFNPGAVARYPKRRETFQQVLDSGKNTDGRLLSEADRKDLVKSIAGLDPVIAEFKNAVQLPPNVTYDHELNLDLGNRAVQVKFLGRANTAGDSVIYLPKEKILLTGDVLDHPVPYFFGGFPSDHIKTLRTLSEIDAQIIVPGHGEVLHDKSYITQVIALLETVTAEVSREINEGKKLPEVQDSVPQAVNVNALKLQFAGTDQENGDFFEQTFAGLVKAAFNQLSMR